MIILLLYSIVHMVLFFEQMVVENDPPLFMVSLIADSYVLPLLILLAAFFGPLVLWLTLTSCSL